MRKRLIITGKVQRVWYRDWFTGEATALGLVGWVRNRHDGSVEAVIEGRDSDVAAMIGKAHEGSPMSEVEDVRSADEPTDEVFETFERRRSG